ncbi:hypothetical protein [Runella sp.]|uniref:hypothetical protein n=1 Tax=Runella sp. TaxID=1960881 RepID=UPI003019FFAC
MRKYHLFSLILATAHYLTAQNQLSTINSSRSYSTPEDFGAVGDGITNDYPSFVKWLAATSNGKLRILSKTYKINGTLTISKNANGASNLEIEGYGAKISTDNPENIPVVRIAGCKNLAVSGLEILGTTDIDGMYFSDFKKCKFQNLKFGFTNSGVFDEHYWNTFSQCDIKEIWIYTGTPKDLTEFNANAFYDCRIWKGEYAIRVYGNQLLQGFSFYNCDISYQQIRILYVDQPMVDGSLSFFGGYWDSKEGLPIDTKGIVVNAAGVITPNSANASASIAKTGSKENVDVLSGVRNGSRLATSSVNLIKNGDLQFGTDAIYNSGLTLNLINGEGMFGKNLRCTSLVMRYIDFEAIPAPYTGAYSVTVIGRNKNNTTIVPVLVKNNAEVLYGPVRLRDASVTDTSFVVTSGNIDLNQGDVLKVRFYTQEGIANDFSIAYCGLTYGRMGTLYAPLHPNARVHTGNDFTGVGIKTTYSQTDVTTNTTLFAIPMGNYARMSAECTCYGIDKIYPDGATFSKHAITANRNEGGITTSLIPINTNSKAGDITSPPIITLFDTGSGILQIKATASDGLINLKCKLEGIY